MKHSVVKMCSSWFVWMYESLYNVLSTIVSDSHSLTITQRILNILDSWCTIAHRLLNEKMIRKNYEYSLKNIPSPSKDAYLKCLINKTEHFIKRMRWKAFFFEKELRKQENGSNEDDEDTPNNFGFKTQKTPPKSVHLKQFEDEMYTLIQQIEFDNRRNDFQQKLKRDCIDIRSSGKLLVPADKSSNLYEMDVDQYNKLLSEKVTQSYRKTNTNAKNYIDLEAKSIANSLGLSDRIQCLAEKDAFIKLKDHEQTIVSDDKSC